jgi:hypothetical protein
MNVGWVSNGSVSSVWSHWSYTARSTVATNTSIARGRPRSCANWSSTADGVIGAPGFWN